MLGKANASVADGRSGFTLIELLVVMAVIAILVGLLLPAVQSAREAANRVTCANNLKQMGLAAQHYATDYGALPPSRLTNGGATWAVLILPHLEQNELFKKWDLAKSYFDQQLMARQTAVTIQFCPSRRSPDTSPRLSIAGDENENADGTLGPQVPGAMGDYACNVGTTGADWIHNLPSMPSCLLPPTGSFQLANQGKPTVAPVPKGIRFNEITDGLSNTLLIGEKHVPLNQFGIGGLDSSLYDGREWYCATRSAGIEYPLAQSIRDPEWKFGSYHPGVCQFVFVDGSVHAISTGIDPATLELLADISDGQTIPPYE